MREFYYVKFSTNKSLGKKNEILLNQTSPLRKIMRSAKEISSHFLTLILLDVKTINTWYLDTCICWLEELSLKSLLNKLWYFLQPGHKVYYLFWSIQHWDMIVNFSISLHVVNGIEKSLKLYCEFPIINYEFFSPTIIGVQPSQNQWH